MLRRDDGWCQVASLILFDVISRHLEAHDLGAETFATLGDTDSCDRVYVHSRQLEREDVVEEPRLEAPKRGRASVQGPRIASTRTDPAQH